MPVVNREKERLIVEEGRRQGKSDEFIKQAVLRFREKELSAQNKKVQQITPSLQKTPAQKSFFGKAADFAQGVGQSILGTARSSSKLAEAVTSVVPEKLKKNFLQKPGSIGFTAISALNASSKIDPLLTNLEKKVGAAEGDLTTPKNTFQKTGKISGDVAQFLYPSGFGAKKAVGALQTAQKAKKDIALIEKIRPVLNKSERQKAIAEKRVIEGKSSFLTGKKPDTVFLDKKTQRAMGTIKEKIPKIDKLNRYEISNAVGEGIKNLSKTATPIMESVSLNNNVAKNFENAWAILKKEQSRTPEFVAFKGAKQAQNIFEEFVKQVKDAKSLDKIWKIRKNYDDIIPDTIKQATDKSAPSTQLQRDMWLENRRLLNNLIEDSYVGLGGEATKLFDKLEDFYTIKNNITRSGNIDLKGKPGFLSKENIKNSVLGKAAAVGLGALGLKELTD